MSTPSDFRPTATREVLQQRALLLQRLRQFFTTRGFLEVDTPLLSTDTVIDRHLDPLTVTLFSDPRQTQTGPTYWLQTSPEFAMKRLLASGLQRIYQVTHAFRGGEAGRYHNPEFTMVEWYRIGDDLESGMGLLADLCEELLPYGRPELLSYEAAFERELAIDPHRADVASMSNTAQKRNIAVPDSIGSDRNDWLNLLLAECVEPSLGQDRPTILFDYPADQAALSQIRQVPPAVAERLELYLRGIELANGYHELLDADELRRRNRVTNEQRQADGKATLPEKSHLLEAMDAGLPACAGTALGFDRLVMLATNSESLEQVLTFPIDRA